METRQNQTASTKQTILNYYEGINSGGWEMLLAEDMVFTIFDKQISGKQAYVAATKRFLQVAKSAEIRKLIVACNDAAVIVRYRLVSPNGNESSAEIAEFLSVTDGKISSNSIFFDTTAFNVFIAPFITRYYKEQL